MEEEHMLHITFLLESFGKFKTILILAAKNCNKMVLQIMEAFS